MGNLNPAEEPRKQKWDAWSIVSLVLAALSVVPCCMFLTGIPAVVTGFIGLYRIQESKGVLKDKWVALAGICVGAAMSLIYGLLMIIGMLTEVPQGIDPAPSDRPTVERQVDTSSPPRASGGSPSRSGKSGWTDHILRKIPSIPSSAAEHFAQVADTKNAGVELAKCYVVFKGNHRPEEVSGHLLRAMRLYNLSQSKISNAASSLIACREQTGVQEMEILDYMIRTGKTPMSFSEAAALSAVFVQAGD